METYPIDLVNLASRRVVVVGSGEVAERKVGGLLAAGARVRVIGPHPTQQIRTWAEAGAISLAVRTYLDGDLAGAFLAVAATDNPSVNRAVSAEAHRGCCLVNLAEGSDRSDFIVPAVVRRGAITVAISTGGASPALARHIRRRVEQVIGPQYAAAAAVLAELRPVLVARFPDEEARSAVVERLLASGLFDQADAEPGETAHRALAWLDAEPTQATAGGQPAATEIQEGNQ